MHSSLCQVPADGFDVEEVIENNQFVTQLHNATSVDSGIDVLAWVYGGGTKLALEQLTLKGKILYSLLCCNLSYPQRQDFE